MRVLLDTHVVLWHLSGERDLPARVVEAIASADDVLVSVLSFAEIGVKTAIGKLDVPSDLMDTVEAAGIRHLQLAPRHGLAVAELPLHHRDPFDRLIIAQAKLEGLTVVTADRRFHAYDIDVLDTAEPDAR